jgi:hypothetical protein
MNAFNISRLERRRIDRRHTPRRRAERIGAAFAVGVGLLAVAAVLAIWLFPQ